MSKCLFLSILCLLISTLSAQAEWGRAADDYFELPLGNGTNICSDGNGGCWAVCDGAGIIHVDRNGNFSWDEAIAVIPEISCWDPQPVLAENGDVIIAMNSSTQQDSFPSVYLQRINLDQERVWGEEGIPLDTFSMSEYIKGVYPGPVDNTYLIHWNRYHNLYRSNNPRLQLIDEDGELLWGVGGIGLDWSHTNSYFTITSDQCIVVAQNVAPFPTIAIIKFDSDGQQVWDKRISLSSDSLNHMSATDIESDLNGGVILTYEYINTDNEDDNLRYYGINAIRISSDGDSLWRREIYEHEAEHGQDTRQGDSIINYSGFGCYFVAWMHWPHSFQVVALNIEGELLWDESVDIILNRAGHGRLDGVDSDSSVCYLWVDTDQERERAQAYFGQRINISGERLWGDRGQAIQNRVVFGHGYSNTTDSNGGVITVVEDRPTIQMINRNGEIGVVLPVSVKKTDEPNLPNEFALESLFPNPFNSTATIVYSVPTTTTISIEVLDIRGRLIDTLVSEHHQIGHYSLKWNAKGLNAGLYFIRLQAGTTQFVKKAVVIK